MKATKSFRRPPPLCCGCQEAEGLIKVSQLGLVCESCIEVLDTVFEVELERIREAIKRFETFLERSEEEGISDDRSSP